MCPDCGMRVNDGCGSRWHLAAAKVDCFLAEGGVPYRHGRKDRAYLLDRMNEIVNDLRADY